MRISDWSSDVCSSDLTHPLLAPLVPRLRDLMAEYEVAGAGRVRVEFVDPLQAPALEEEENRRYNIKPVPFQPTNQYHASVPNSYLQIVVQSGHEIETLRSRHPTDNTDRNRGKNDNTQT